MSCFYSELRGKWNDEPIEEGEAGAHDDERD
jgi:hypothetical protein